MRDLHSNIPVLVSRSRLDPRSNKSRIREAKTRKIHRKANSHLLKLLMMMTSFPWMGVHWMRWSIRRLWWKDEESTWGGRRRRDCYRRLQAMRTMLRWFNWGQTWGWDLIVSVIHCFHSLTLDILAHYIIEPIILAEFQLTTRSRNDQGLDPCQPLLKPEARLIQSGQTLLCYFFCTLSFSEKSEKLAFWRVDKEKAYMDNHNSTKLQKRQLHHISGRAKALLKKGINAMQKIVE